MGKLILLAILSLSHFAFAGKTLILIGYADDNSSGLFYKMHYHTVAKETEDAIREAIPNDSSEQFIILNSNVICPNEIESVNNFRFRLCDQQLSRINQIMDFLNSSRLKEFNRLIYIGHARSGLGLGIGPFVQEYTFDLRFFNPSERGELNTILLASCNSNELYKHLKNQVRLIGTSRKLLWLKDLLPMVLEEIKL